MTIASGRVAPGVLALSLTVVVAGSAHGESPAAVVNAAPTGVIEATPGTAPTGDPSIVYRDGRLSVRVTQMPIGDVLAAVSHATGAEIRGAPEPRLVTQTFVDMPLNTALERLVGGRNFMLRYGDGKPRVIDFVGASSETPVPLMTATPHATMNAAATPMRSPLKPGETPPPHRGSLMRFEAEMQRHPPIPISGPLADAFGGEHSVNLDAIMKAALNDDRPGIRDEALRVGLEAIEADPMLGEAFLAWFNSMDDATAASGLKSLPGAHAEDFLAGVARNARSQALRDRVTSILDRMPPPLTPEP